METTTAILAATESRARPVIPVERRASQRLVARERRRETQRLAEALDQGQLRLTRTARTRLSDGALTAEDLSLHWPRAALSAAASLSASGHNEITLRVRHWMLEQACAGATRSPVPVTSVPIPRAMLAGGLVPEVGAVLDHAGLPASRLELRLTEESLHDPSSELLWCLSGLRREGVRLAIDDWGRRHGSIALLRHVRFDAVYLDPSLTHDLSPGSEDEAVVGPLVKLAHALGLAVIARAIAGPGRLETLRQLGVDEGLVALG